MSEVEQNALRKVDRYRTRHKKCVFADSLSSGRTFRALEKAAGAKRKRRAFGPTSEDCAACSFSKVSNAFRRLS